MLTIDFFHYCSKSYYACPDDETFRYMAKLYSGSHFNMSQSQEFKAGITNGALWYVTCSKIFKIQKVPYDFTEI